MGTVLADIAALHLTPARRTVERTSITATNEAKQGETHLVSINFLQAIVVDFVGVYLIKKAACPVT